MRHRETLPHLDQQRAYQKPLWDVFKDKIDTFVGCLVLNTWKSPIQTQKRKSAFVIPFSMHSDNLFCEKRETGIFTGPIAITRLFFLPPKVRNPK